MPARGDIIGHTVKRVSDTDHRRGRATNASCIAMVSPASENNEAFLSVGAQLAKAGVRAPAVWTQSLERGWFLLEDFGDQQLLAVLASHRDSAAALYQKAFDALECQISLPIERADIPYYDAERLKTELEVFPEWFLSGLLGIQPDEQLRRCFTSLTDYLISAFTEQPTVWVHRDFHSRNLMLLGANELGVIDFQDAVLGPITYDPVSLLKDAIPLATGATAGVAERLFGAAKASGGSAPSVNAPTLGGTGIAPAGSRDTTRGGECSAVSAMV